MEKISNELMEELFLNRFTAKAYDGERVVAERDWQTILRAGQLSPSSLGIEPWKFLRLKNKEIVQAISPFAWGGREKFAGASHILVLLVRKGEHLRPGSQYTRHILQDVKGMSAEDIEIREEMTRKFLQNDLQISRDDQLQAWASRQVYIALANMLTTAAALGVDSTPIEGFNVAEVNRILVEAGAYDGSIYEPVVMACFGYASAAPLPKTRQDLADIYSEI